MLHKNYYQNTREMKIENLKTETVTIEKTKEFLNLAKEIMKKTRETIEVERR